MPITDINNGNALGDSSADSVWENFNQVKTVFTEFTPNGGYQGTSEDLQSQIIASGEGFRPFDTVIDADSYYTSNPPSEDEIYIVNSDTESNNGYYTRLSVDNTGRRDRGLIPKKIEDRDYVINEKRGFKTLPIDFDFTSVPSDFSKSIWEIRELHDLGGNTVTIPEGVTLEFKGGSIVNGTLNLNNTDIKADRYKIFGTDLILTGSSKSSDFYSEWWGASSVSGFDNLTFIRDCINGVEGLDNTPTVVFDSVLYEFSDTLDFKGLSIDCKSPLKYTGANDRTAVILGLDNAANINSNLNVWVENTNVSDWSNDDCVGVVIYNQFTSKINLNVRNFTTNVIFHGKGSGFSYNHVEIRSLISAKTQLILTQSNNGYINQNSINGGRLTNFSSNGIGLSRYGVVITSEDLTYINNNANTFNDVSFELKIAQATDGNPAGEAIAVIVEHGNDNVFLNCRQEFNSNEFARVENESARNEFKTTFGRIFVEDNSIYPTSILKDSQTYVSKSKEYNVISFRYNNFCNKYTLTKTGVNYPFFFGSSSNANKFYNDNSSTIPIDGGFLGLVSSRTLGVIIDSSNTKSFKVCRNNKNNNGGRLLIRCYDSAGNVLDNTSQRVFGNSDNGLVYTTSYGGAYREASDRTVNQNFTFFKVSNEVVYFHLLFTNMDLVDFTLKSLDSSTTFIPANTKKGIYVGAIPDVADYDDGTVVYSDEATVHSYIKKSGVWKTVSID